MAIIDNVTLTLYGDDRRAKRDEIKDWLRSIVGPIIDSKQIRDGEGPEMKGHAVCYYGTGWQYMVGWQYKPSADLCSMHLEDKEQIVIDDETLAVQFKLTFC
jgi:hypothetical protein